MAQSETSISPRRSLAVRACRALIRLYQWQSPFWGPRCRFYPSCSEYMREALQEFGVAKGLWWGTRRLFKCHPWHPGGVDPIRTLYGK